MMKAFDSSLTSRPVRSRLLLGAAFGVASLAALVPPSPAQNGQLPTEQLTATSPDKGGPDHVPAAINREPVQVLVELQEPPSSRVFARAVQTEGASEADAQGRAESHVTYLKGVQSQMVSRLGGSDIQASAPLWTVQRAFNGVAITVDPNNIPKILKLEGVKAVHKLVPKTPLAASSIPYLGTFGFWNTVAQAGLNIHGEGIKLAVMDSGIDYLHTDFGGPGTGYDVNNTTIVEPGIPYPGPRVKGGRDFAGDAYTASNAPQPDDDPIDCNPNGPGGDPATIGHGTGAAGLAGGSGVNADGSTYTGPYDSTTPIASMRISPGVAPKSDLYSLRVFGCEGSTNLVIPALDWALDPAHKMDVVSASLGADQQSFDDPDSLAASNAAAQGVITVFAAGNAGDTYYTTGSPSSGTGTIAVAASYNDNLVYSGVNVTAPFTARDIGYPAAFGPALTAAGVSGKVVYAVPAIANTPLTNAASIAGNICLVDRGTVTFKTKVLNAQNAGATAVIIANNGSAITTPGDDPTITTPITIPTVLISQADGNAIKAVITTDANSPVTATLTSAGPNGVDTLPGYTSRGPRRGDSALKPDITAPAELVSTAANGTGNNVETFNGTSSATPHVAGAMALMKQLHPTWTVEQLKALVMNTADRNLFSQPESPRSPKIGPGRIGAGRMDLATAAKANVVAYAATPSNVSGDSYAPVNVNFGVVDVPAGGAGRVSANQVVNLVNKGTTAVNYKVSFLSVGTDVPGVTFAVPATITVPAGSGGTDGLITMNVTMNAVASQMKHTHDPSIDLVQSGLPRHWLSEATGYLVLTPTNGSATLRLTVYAAPRPVSDMHAPTTLDLNGGTGTTNLTLTGTGINTGTNYPTDIVSLNKALELQYLSPDEDMQSAVVNGADIKHVGVTSDFAKRAGSVANTVLSFGIATYGNNVTPDYLASEFDVLIDTTGGTGFTPNFLMYDNVVGGQGRSSTNVYQPLLVNLANSASITRYFTNGYAASTFDTNIFNNSVMMMSVRAGDLGLTTGGSTRIKYVVQTFAPGGAFTDASPVLTYDLANPGVVEGGTSVEPFLDQDLPGNAISLNYNTANLAANGSQGVMVMHFHNATGARSEAVVANPPRVVGFSPTSGPVGTRVTIFGQNLTGTTAVRFNGVAATSFRVSADGTQIIAIVPAGATTGFITVDTAAGTVTTKSRFFVTAQ